MRQSTDTCAGCGSFPSADLATTGRTVCPWREVVVTWDQRACVLHTPASDRRARAPMVARLTEASR
jgi:hypothetical protein